MQNSVAVARLRARGLPYLGGVGVTSKWSKKKETMIKNWVMMLLWIIVMMHLSTANVYDWMKLLPTKSTYQNNMLSHYCVCTRVYTTHIKLSLQLLAKADSDCCRPCFHPSAKEGSIDCCWKHLVYAGPGSNPPATLRMREFGWCIREREREMFVDVPLSYILVDWTGNWLLVDTNN